MSHLGNYIMTCWLTSHVLVCQPSGSSTINKNISMFQHRHLVGDGNNDGRPTARCRLKLVEWCNGHNQCFAFPEFDKSDIEQQRQNEKEKKKKHTRNNGLIRISRTIANVRKCAFVCMCLLPGWYW